MSKEVKLHLPNPELMQGEDQNIFEEFAARSLSSFESGMGEICRPSPVTEVGCVDIRAKNEAKSSRALVLLLPFGNGYTPAMDMRAVSIAAFLPEDTRIVVFPNNTTKQKNYEFVSPDQERDGVELLGCMVLRTCSDMGIDEIAIAGYSQGASVGASMLVDAERYGVRPLAASLGDPANVVTRTPKELKKAFLGTGLGNLNKAINDSGVPALTKAQLSGGGIDAARQLIMFAGAAKGGSLPENVALHESMTQNRFLRDVKTAATSGVDLRTVMITRMTASLVCTDQLQYDAETGGFPFEIQEVFGYGHEGGDNIIDNALRVRKALSRADFWRV